jgi:hypothetical protein
MMQQYRLVTKYSRRDIAASTDDVASVETEYEDFGPNLALALFAMDQANLSIFRGGPDKLKRFAYDKVFLETREASEWTPYEKEEE